MNLGSGGGVGQNDEQGARFSHLRLPSPTCSRAMDTRRTPSGSGESARDVFMRCFDCCPVDLVPKYSSGIAVQAPRVLQLGEHADLPCGHWRGLLPPPQSHANRSPLTPPLPPRAAGRGLQAGSTRSTGSTRVPRTTSSTPPRTLTSTASRKTDRDPPCPPAMCARFHIDSSRLIGDGGCCRSPRCGAGCSQLPWGEFSHCLLLSPTKCTKCTNTVGYTLEVSAGNP